MPEIIDMLKAMDIFKHIQPFTLNNLANISVTKEYKKNTVIYQAKRKINHVFFILNGKVIIYNMTHNGNRKIIFILGKGKMINFNVINNNLTSVFCESIENAEILMIENTKFLKLLEQDFELSKTLISEYEKYLWRMSHQLKNTIGNIYIEKKVAAKLWKLSRDFGIQTPEGIVIDIEMTITFTADFIGAPRESVSRACKKLIDKKLIKFENKKFIILDMKRLSEYYKNYNNI